MRDLTQHLTTRADDNHAPPVTGVPEGKGLSLVRSPGCQALVRFFALLRIKPHTPLLVRAPVNSFEFQPHRLFEKFGFEEVFGRSAVMELLELKSSGASKLLSNLVQADIIEPVSGHGKGKYKFKK